MLGILRAALCRMWRLDARGLHVSFRCVRNYLYLCFFHSGQSFLFPYFFVVGVAKECNAFAAAASVARVGISFVVDVVAAAAALPAITTYTATATAAVSTLLLLR